VTDPFDSLPSDLAAAQALILAERAARMESQARAASASTPVLGSILNTVYNGSQNLDSNTFPLARSCHKEHHR
jgi:hypothetical protein